VLWDNQADDGAEATDMLHEGEPPVSGDKYVITKWFRERKL
jgi:prolyl 4-hydroxylase